MVINIIAGDFLQLMETCERDDLECWSWSAHCLLWHVLGVVSLCCFVTHAIFTRLSGVTVVTSFNKVCCRRSGMHKWGDPVQWQCCEDKTWQGVGTELLTEETMELLTEETMELLMEESMELLVVETMELVSAGDVEQWRMDWWGADGWGTEGWGTEGGGAEGWGSPGGSGDP